MSDQSPVTVLLVGIGGYGQTYVNALLDQPQPERACLVGVVDPYAERCKRLAEIQQRGVPVFSSLEEFQAQGQADLTVISSPIHLHCRQTCAALAAGSNVLCEKPVAPTIQEARRMHEAARRQGRFAAVGYQWSFSPATQALKRDVLAGRFGSPRRLRTLVLWPRNEAYYARNNWAGALKSAQGDWILDSPVNNATAHYLHNMFFILGDSQGRSAMPARLQAELYRANPISNYDTGVVRAWTADGVEVLFYCTHTTARLRGPEYIFEFERGTVCYDTVSKHVVATCADGARQDYGSPDDATTRKLWDCVAAVRGGAIACDVEAASAHTLCMNGMQESAEPAGFPARMVSRQGEEGARVTVVDGLDTALEQAYERGVLPAEMGLPWAVAGREVDLRGYAEFPRA